MSESEHNMAESESENDTSESESEHNMSESESKHACKPACKKPYSWFVSDQELLENLPQIFTFLRTASFPSGLNNNYPTTCGMYVTQSFILPYFKKKSTGDLAASSQVRSYSKQDSQYDSYQMKYFDYSQTTIHMDITDKMHLFINEFGLPQKMKINETFRSFASINNRLKSFNQYPKTMMHAYNKLCHTGLFYVGSEAAENRRIKCYCCGNTFNEWQHNINPWVQHALRSPECPFLLLYKAKLFVKHVHDTYTYIRINRRKPDIQSIIYDFEFWDSRLVDRSLAMYDSKRYYDCIAPVVSEIIEQIFSDLIEPVTINLCKKKPLPKSITCILCCVEKMEVCFIPCGHIFACIQCAVSLTHCAICRVSFSASTFAMRIFIEEEDDNGESTSSNSSNDSCKSVLCRKCNKRNIGVVFIPCRHAHTCYKCAATKEKSCPVCFEPFIGFMEVFI